MSIKRLVPLNLPALDTLPALANKGDLAYKNSDGKVYVYDGSTWVVSSGGGGGVVSMSTTQPANPVDGQIWVDSDSDVPVGLNPLGIDGGSPPSTYTPGSNFDGGSP